ncbi:MAG: alpha-glucuronidase family glycosyl hydrolase [Opitutaceae bacterium]
MRFRPFLPIAAAPALLALFLLPAGLCRAEGGYRLWLRYPLVPDAALRASYAAALPQVAIRADSPTLRAAEREISTGLRGLLGTRVPVVERSSGADALLLGTPAGDPEIGALGLGPKLASAGPEGFVLRELRTPAGRRVVVAANSDLGVLYGTFALLRRLQTDQPLDGLDVTDAPRISRRILDHWDNLDGTRERGYSGFSIWKWAELPGTISPRYRDYARADASIGINGAVLNNVNADPRILTAQWLPKVAALAKVFRPYGIRVYLSVRFSAPIDVGALKTADPADPAVRAWWRSEADSIYRLIPDFGGFLVKANSEGEPGPQDYGRTHADGANLLADALAPHGGIVMWRAFVYDQNDSEDRTKQAYDEFKPLDGKFRSNVVIQIKNGPLDFQPREPFHPLFGAMPHTALALELQITQEYLGDAVHLVYLAPLYKECLESDTWAEGPGSTVAKIVEGRLDRHALSVIAGVANVGSDRNWCGHPFAAANWYAFGRLAWDPALSSSQIADEWIRMTWSNDARFVKPVLGIMLRSREAAVDYMTPLGLAHLMATDHHYGPGPWARPGPLEWTPAYYHRADREGLGFDRTEHGSDAVAQYAPEVARRFDSLSTCPEDLLLWFHHVPWGYRLQSGRTLWDALALHYQHGVDEVRASQRIWAGLEGRVDEPRFVLVSRLLARQERNACEWRDACLLYFQQFSRRPLPPGVDRPAHTLAFYEAIDRHFVQGALAPE